MAYGLRELVFAALVVVVPGAVRAQSFIDSAGREWVNFVSPPNGVDWTQAAQYCPTDGATKCNGGNFDGWVWGTLDQVRQMFAELTLLNNGELDDDYFSETNSAWGPLAASRLAPSYVGHPENTPWQSILGVTSTRAENTRCTDDAPEWAVDFRCVYTATIEDWYAAYNEDFVQIGSLQSAWQKSPDMDSNVPNGIFLFRSTVDRGPLSDRQAWDNDGDGVVETLLAESYPPGTPCCPNELHVAKDASPSFSPGTSRAAMEFPIAPTLPRSRILSAKLFIRPVGAYSLATETGRFQIRVHSFDGDGSVSLADMLTNRPIVGPTAWDQFFVPVTEESPYGFAIDVTPAIRALDPTSRFLGLMFEGVTPSGGFSFASRESETWARPLLRIELAPPPGALTLHKRTVAGCKYTTGSVTLRDPAPVGGVLVMLSDTLDSVSVPVSMTIPIGATTKNFTVRTVPVAGDEAGVVTATIGDAALSRLLAVRRMGLSAITLSSSTVVGGQSSMGTATLECLAGPGPVTVDLSTSNATVANPVATTVVVPQGLKSQTFTVATNPVLSKSSALITGEASTTTKTRRLSVVPAAEVSTTSLRFGNTPVGQASASLSVVLRNNGVVPFAVNSISVTGTYASWYSQTNTCPGDLAAGSSCTISVTFTPQAVLSKLAKLSIVTTATSTPLSVSLSGTGI